MFRYIRWQGIVAFVALGAAVAVLWLLVVDGLVKTAIEKIGTRLVGAKVELAGADVSFSPLGLELTGLQVTDPDEPMTNIFEFRRAAFGLDTGQLVKRRAIINEMSLEGVQTGTQRKTSGAIQKKAKDTKEGKEAVEGRGGLGDLLGGMSFPDIKDILEKEDLRTLSMARDFQTDVKGKEEEFKKRINELPDEKKLKQYEQRAKEIEKLIKKGFPAALEGASMADKLKKDIDKDLKNINRVKTDLDKTISNYEKRIKEIQNAPAEDVARLKRKYAPSSSGAVNASRILLGPVMSSRLQRVLSFWDRYGTVSERIKKARASGEERPPRGEGVNIRFPERNPLPVFLVRKSLVTAEHKGSAFSGEILNITFEQDVLGEPLSYDFSGKTLKWAESLLLSGAIDRTKPGSPVDSLKAILKGYDTSGVKLSGGGSLPMDLTAGGADLDFSVRRATDSLDASADANVKGLRLILDKEQAKLGSLTDAVEEALASITSAKIDARATGTVDDYKVTVTSDVDDKLKSAVSGFVKKQVEQFEQKLSAGVREAVDDRISGLDGELKGLNVLDGQIDSIQNSLDQVLKQFKIS